MADELDGKGKRAKAVKKIKKDGDESQGQRKLDRKSVEASIRAQVAAEQKAHEIVERLVLDDNITQKYFTDIGNYISTSHYQDVITERSIAKVCGYPLCNKPLVNVPKQKYRISTKTNRVYDITERKNFCSNSCYKASKFYESQLSSAPVWTDLGKEPKQFSIFAGGDETFNAHGSGDIMFGSESMDTAKNVKDTSSRQENQSSQENTVEKDLKGQQIQHQTIVDAISTGVKELTCSHGAQNKDTSKGNVIEVKEQQVTHDSSSETFPGRSSGNHVSVEITQKEDDNKNTSNNLNNSSQHANEKTQLSSNSQHSSTYSHRRILQDTAMDTLAQWFTSKTSDYISLENAEDKTPAVDARELSFEEKALLFLTTSSDADHEETEEGLAARVVPPIDNRSQVAIRTNIILQSLSKVLPEILACLRLSMSDVFSDLAGLVRTFRLDSRNTMMKPLQWKLIAYSLLYLLCHRNETISKNLASSNFSESFLSSVGLTEEELKLFGSKVEDLLQVMGRQQNAHPHQFLDDTKGRSNEHVCVGTQDESFSLMEELD